MVKMTSKYEILLGSNATTTPCIPPGEGVLNKVLYREAPPRGPTPYPAMKYHSDRKGTQLFRLPSFDKIWYCPFHIPSLELCIPF